MVVWKEEVERGSFIRENFPKLYILKTATESLHTIRALYPCFVRKSAFFSPTQNTSGQGLASPARGGPVTQQGPRGRRGPRAAPRFPRNESSAS